MSTEIIHFENQRERRMKKNEQNLRSTWDNIRYNKNLSRREKKRSTENISKIKSEHLAYWLRCLHPTSERQGSYIPGSSSWLQNLTNADAGIQWWWLKVTGFLPFILMSWIAYQAHGSSAAQPQPLWIFRGGSLYRSSLSLFLFLKLINYFLKY